VVAYSLPGVQEVVDDGRTGRLAPPGDVRLLAAAAVALLGDAKGRGAMGRAGAERCLRFDIGTVAPAYLEVYRSLSSSGSPASRGPAVGWPGS
jgi:L-malate glycosyltransferase